MRKIRQILGVDVHDVEVPQYTQTLLVVGVATILVTRLYLQLTGFPKIGGGSGLHVAHVLIGGALMTVTMVLLLGFLGKQVRGFASVLGGIGFGLFIDELGKFLTQDNNYFFQPTIALIYVVFIALFLWVRAIAREKLSCLAKVANAVNLLQDSLVSGPSRHDLGRALHYLQQSGLEGQLANAIHTALLSVREAHVDDNSPIAWSAAGAWRAYDRLTEWPFFVHAARSLFLVRGVVGAGFAIAVAVATLGEGHQAPSTLDADRVAAVLAVATSFVVLLLIVAGAVLLGKSRIDAYEWFEHALLISIFFAQVTLFWLAELAAVGLLLVDLVLLGVIRFMIRQARGRVTLAQLAHLGNAPV